MKNDYIHIYSFGIYGDVFYIIYKMIQDGIEDDNFTAWEMSSGYAKDIEMTYESVLDFANDVNNADKGCSYDLDSIADFFNN